MIDRYISHREQPTKEKHARTVRKQNRHMIFIDWASLYTVL